MRGLPVSCVRYVNRRSQEMQGVQVHKFSSIFGEALNLRELGGSLYARLVYLTHKRMMIKKGHENIRQGGQ